MMNNRQIFRTIIMRPSKRHAYDPEASSRARLFDEFDDEYKLVSVSIISKRRPVVLYSIPAQDADLWYVGRIIHDE